MLDGFYTSVNRRGNKILYRGYDSAGIKKYERFKFQPTMYLKSGGNPDRAGWKSIHGEDLHPQKFGSMTELREFRETYKGVPGFELHGNDKPIPAFIESQFPLDIKFKQSQIDIASFDIETESGSGFPDVWNPRNEILTITYKSSKEDFYRIWGLKDYDVDQSEFPSFLPKKFVQFKDEASLLNSFIDFISDPKYTPDVLTGWNSRFFDIPYIIRRAMVVVGESRVKFLSPWKMVDENIINVMGREQLTYNIVGIQALDYMALFEKFTLNTYGRQESYRLDFIADLVLGQKKLEYDGTLQELYDNDFQKFVDYNVRDVELLERLEDKLGLIRLVFTLAYMAGVNYEDTLGTVAFWDSLIFRRLARKKVAIPPNEEAERTPFEGAYVKAPQVGLHDWIMSFDLASLYPNLMIQYNMSPETLVEQTHISGVSPDNILSSTERLTEDDVAVVANGTCFRKDKQGIIPEIITELFDGRKIIKNKMLKKKQDREDLQKKLDSLVKRYDR